MQPEVAREQAPCWPNALQEKLLRATILDGDAARSGWEEWVGEADFDNLDEGSNRLIPETYTNLVANGIEHPLLGRMKGIKRRTWLENQLLFHQATAAITVLDDAGIDTMVTKGPALVLCHYHDHGRRPMADFDLIVRRKNAERAIHLLREAGFKLIDPKWNGSTEFGLLHALTYVNDMGRQFDLHWHVVSGCSLEDPFWDAAEEAALNDTATLAPCPTDLLLNNLVHGLRPNDVPPLRWVVDAATILNGRGIDWDRLVETANSLRFSYRMAQALNYLERFGIETPERVYDELGSSSDAGFQKLEFDRISGVRKKSFTTQFASTWLNFHRFTPPGQAKILSLPHYLKASWEVERTWQLPAVAVEKSVRRLLGRPAAGRPA